MEVTFEGDTTSNRDQLRSSWDNPSIYPLTHQYLQYIFAGLSSSMCWVLTWSQKYTRKAVASNTDIGEVKEPREAGRGREMSWKAF